jgi:hypothetical protein
VKESKVDRVEDGLMNCEECVESSGCRLLKTDRNGRGRGLHPAVDGERLFLFHFKS